MYITDAFFEEPVRNIIQRCVEHGIWNALWSISVHLQRIDENRRNFTQLSDFGPLINETKYEFWILIIVLAMATIVFWIELCVGKL